MRTFEIQRAFELRASRGKVLACIGLKGRVSVVLMATPGEATAISIGCRSRVSSDPFRVQATGYKKFKMGRKLINSRRELN